MKKTRLLVFLLFGALSANAQLILPGDYPDPSVTKVGDTYWASATTSNWAPAYPLLSSKDLLHWETRGFVFPELPGWADYYFWAPEISYENGRVYIYYSAHKRDGNLCLGIASAEKPEGPYKDHGPIMCQEVGSIDAFPVRDENGKLYLVWKEDGNSVGRPTPIWISEMKEDRSGLVGEKRELFRNEAPWESNLVEGVSMVRHGQYYYAFYAAAGCCGRDCTYATGVARSKSLFGPWEKYPRNPLLSHDQNWKCPGHGTPIEKDGKFFFLYHAYNKESGVYAGRQGLLKEFYFTPDDWIAFKEKDVKVERLIPEKDVEEFSKDKLDLDWQWSVFQSPVYSIKNDALELAGLGKDTTTFIGKKTLTANYKARTTIRWAASSSEAGLALIGDDDNFINATVIGPTLKLTLRKAGKDSVVTQINVPKGQQFFLEMKVEGGKEVTFTYSTDGKKFTTLTKSPLDASYLPPWDRALRVGLTSRGAAYDRAVFENFILYH
jgi:xylan 1,4-beta-xylosidase